MSTFAAFIIRTVRSDLQSFNQFPRKLFIELYRASDIDDVVNAFPLLLVTENDDVLDCISRCLASIEYYEDFNLWKKVLLQRGEAYQGRKN